MSPLLVCDSLSVQLHGQTILHPLSFQINSGEIVGIIGPNGAGKTTLLRTLQRHIIPLSGNVLLSGKPLSEFNRHELARQLAMVSQESNTVFALLVQQVVAMGLLPHKSWYQFTSSQDEQRVELALSQVGLQHKAFVPLHQLSGGELQRVYIARALVQQATILLLDEPTNHLDVRYQHQILGLLRQHPVSALLSIHDLNLAARYCDKLLLLHQGNMLVFGSPVQVLQPALLQQVFELPCVVDATTHDSLQVTFLPEAVC